MNLLVPQFLSQSVPQERKDARGLSIDDFFETQPIVEAYRGTAPAIDENESPHSTGVIFQIMECRAKNLEITECSVLAATGPHIYTDMYPKERTWPFG
jgi:hypothetical protein